jgi:hypothetical protein
VQAADVARYFEQYGWVARRTGERDWQTTFTGDLATFTVEVHLTDDWLHFVIDLSSFGWLDTPDQVRRLLAANADMLLARFAIGPQANLLLRIDMPTEGFVYSHFVDCLGALSHYADLFHHSALR